MSVTTIALSQQLRSDSKLGEVNALNVHPGEFTSNGWTAPEQGLQLDVRDEALFQNFSRKNSAFILKPGESAPPVVSPRSPVERSPSASPKPQSDTFNSSTDESLETNDTSDVQDIETPVGESPTSENETESDSTPDPVEPEAAPNNSVETESEDTTVESVPETVSVNDDAEVNVYQKATASVLAAFTQVVDKLLFLNASSTVEEGDDVAEEHNDLTDESNDVEVISEEDVILEEVTPTEVEEIQSSDSPENVAITDSDAASSTSNFVVTPEVTSTTSTTSVLTNTEDHEASSEAAGHERFVMSFSDFSIPKLEPGEFITGVQLRASLAARYTNAASGTMPYFDFTYLTPSSTAGVGSVVFEEETSNALNGGYFLFALPLIETEEELDDVTIEVAFIGEREQIEEVFFDALWLEVHTEKITREDLERRTQADVLRRLGLPTSNEFVSGKLDFTREEIPVFNLRYVSQRSRVVQSVRNLFGYDKVNVSKVNLFHGGNFLTDIKPEVTVTAEGLISFVFPENETEKLKPGQYTVEFLVDEGGYTFSDSFNFQWGLLAINSNQSEYEVGETAEISAAALTPNGNTICDAQLRLYVIQPDEFIQKIPVDESGLCNGNNVIDVPDYSASLETTIPGVYELYLERINSDGLIISHTSDTFEVVSSQSLSITRNGPTRIYPPAPYEMELTVGANTSFDGVVLERVPASFEVFNTDARVETVGEFKELTWDVSLSGGDQATYSYSFDAPDLSPHLYQLGPAELTGVSPMEQLEPQVTASSSETVPDLPIRSNVRTGFVEHRQWQIASDATGNMILFWDDGASIPAGWTCLSCGSGPFFERFIRGGSTYNSTGGSTTHTPTAVGSVLSAALSATEVGTGSIAPIGHSHSLTPTISTASNLPLYRQLRVIQYTDGAGEPPTIPVGAIGIFDVASSSLPTGWNRYAEQDGYHIRGGDTVGATGGSNTHTHSLTGTTGTSAGAGTRTRGPVEATGASDTHTHTVSSATASINNEPPYEEVVLAKLSATAAPPEGLIAMWTEDVPANWSNQSSSTDSIFHDRFLKGAPVYSSVGGSVSHTHADVNGILSSAPVQGGITGRAGAAGVSQLHVHSVSIYDFSTTDHLPPYTTVIFGELLGARSVFTQNSYRWYVNENSQTPTDPWPQGASDLNEQEPITSASSPLKPGEVLRLRMNVSVENATATASTSPDFEYAPMGDSCSSISTWYKVGSAASSSVWRGYNNASVNDKTTLTTTLLASTTVAETYEENGDPTSLPNTIAPGEQGEWDFVIQHNGASPGTTYCFRMARNDGLNFSQYRSYPTLLTNHAPEEPILFKLFNNEKTASTSPWFEFETTDPEDEDVAYQIQIDNDSDFSSPVADHNSGSNSALFENLVVPSDKSPFTDGQLIRYKTNASLTDNTTYWWRVRARDPDGSEAWGEWSSERSLTIDTTLAVSAWYQTTEAQLTTNTLVGVEAVTGDQLQLISGSSTGTSTSESIRFADADKGTSWGSLEWNDTETQGDIKYHLQYVTLVGVWHNLPESVLPGNGAGFDTSPVSLLDINTDDYSTLRVKAVFNDVGGSPSLQDWTLSWGYRVEQPTITKLFPNEKVGSLTPVFEFTTADPQSDDLTYQIAWSETNDFSGTTTTRTSDTDAGFSNSDAGADTDPFNSGDTIQFTIQPADVLSNNTTYWWRVRAKDTTGDDVYSFWTTPQSFTVATGTEFSTWFQTTEEQFNSDTLSGTIELENDTLTVATTASEAMIVYGQGVETEPRYREWDGTTWGSEGELGDIGAPLKWSVVKAGVTREEYVAATVGTDADVNVHVFAEGAWGNLQELTTSMGNVNARGFDVAYETLSGDALVVYCDGDADPSYYIWNGVSWTSGGTINLASTNNCAWIKLASDPTSDEIILLARDSVGTGAASYEAQVWNGSTWGNSTTQGGAISSLDEGMALAYEDSGGQALIVTGDGNPARFEWKSWNGSAWTAAATDATISDNLKWAKLVPDEGSDAMTLCYIDESANVGAIRWTGAAWTGQINLDAAANAVTDRAVDCVYETTAGRDAYSLVTYSDTVNARSRFWNGATWSTPETTISIITDASTVASARTGDGTILTTFFDDVNDRLDFSMWNGSSWSVLETLESDMPVDSSPFGEPVMMAPRNSGTEGTVIVSPGIDFTAGVGPYWNEMSWVDSTPGASEILYSVQYYDSGDSSWKFIPDSAIPGNSTGTTTSPIDLSGLNISTYDLIRPYAFLTCDGPNSCPVLEDWTVEWAGGIMVSGTLQGYDQTTNTATGTVAVAVNGNLQLGKTGSVSSGTWSIDNVTAFSGDVITVFVTGAADQNEAVGVARYDGVGDITGVTLFERHVTLGSNNATTTPLTNADIGAYDFTNTEDVFFGLSSTTLTVCAGSGCSDAELYILPGTTYAPGGKTVTHDFENNGTFIAGTHTIEVNGSWDNNATTTMTDSTVVFAATSTSETIDATGAALASFNHVTFGTTTGNATWNLSSTLDINGNLIVSRGTLTRGATPITVAGTLTNGTNGIWSGIGTTTFDGSIASTWSDQNGIKQNIGNVVIDGSNKVVLLGSDVAAQSITIGDNDTLDTSFGNYTLTVYESWLNNNTFFPRNGEVQFVATSSPQFIDVGGDAFYDLTFNGAGGGWSFIESTLTVNNDFTIATGTITLPTATTTIVGSFNNSGGTFAHNNSVINFTSNGVETITTSGTQFDNAFYNLVFDGGGSWTFTEAFATSSNDVFIDTGTVVFPTGVLAVGGSLRDRGGSFNANNGTVLMYSSLAESIQAGGSSFNNLTIDGSGTFTFVDTNATIASDLTTSDGTLTLPSGILTLGGSLLNASTLVANSGEILFNSTDTGETINFGSSSAYDLTFNAAGGGWTITSHATATNDVVLTNANTFTLDSGQVLSVGNVFTNSVGGAATTWTGSTLVLQNGEYSINTKANAGDTYGTLRIAATAGISIWNSNATAYDIASGGYLYSMDHAATNGDLYVWGDYVNDSGSEYWSYTTDFDGTALGGGNERQVDVRIAGGASLSFDDSAIQIIGTASASTTIANQGSGTYTIDILDGSINAQYYEFADLGATGLSLLDAVTVSSFNNGSYIVAGAASSALTISSTTIDANPAKQIFDVTFATTTAIVATNVTQTDGTPTSYWWFRNSAGNLDGEVYDNDTGNPGSIRWDDSALNLTISGTVYADDGVTPLGGTTCDGDLQEPITIVVADGGTHTGVCEADGTFSVSGVTVVGAPVLTIYLNGAAGGERASVVTKTPTADITNLDLYVNRVIVRHEDVAPLTIADMSGFDSSDDTDITFTAATSSGSTLTLRAGNELHVWTGKTFTPGGEVTLAGNALANAYDGTLHLGQNATFEASGTTTYSVAGSVVLENGANFIPASSTLLMTATTTGKTITTVATSSLAAHAVSFVGVGGGWNVNGNIEASSDIVVATGTVTGTGNVTLSSGSLFGDGLLSFGGGTVTIDTSNTLGGQQPWSFYNLTLGNGIGVGTTTPASAATTTILNQLTIASAHFLDAGTSLWELAGSGAVLAETGTLLEDTSTFTYSGTGATNITSTGYHNLYLNAVGGSPTYTATGLGIQVFGDMRVGGMATTSVTFNTNDTALNVDGNFAIAANGTFIASDSGTFTLAGNYDNDGVFTAGTVTLTFDGSGAQTIAPGDSPFATVLLSGTGSYTVLEHATATVAFTIGTTLTAFTLDSGQVLAVGGTFSNALGGAATTWTGSTLSLYGGGNYQINAKTITDSYETLTIADDTQIRMWNSDAVAVNVGGGSLYSMDHANTPGDLYIYGAYRNTAMADYWSYATDFDGVSLSGGGEREADVFVESGASVFYGGTAELSLIGAPSASTTLQNQGSGTYSLIVGGTASTTMNYYVMGDMNSDGLTFTGSVDVDDVSYGHFIVGNDNDSAITVGGSAINNNPAKTFTLNRFATTSGVTTAVNVTATGTSVSSWRFTNHTGEIDGEPFDVDPDGDPGYVAWDDSAASINVSGTVYSDEGSTVSAACPGAAVRVRVAGLTSYDTTCNGSGVYTVSGVTYSSGDSIVVYLNDETENAAAITKDPISNINNMDLYENRVIVRHEGVTPLAIDDMAVWDTSDDADVLFTAVSGSPDTLTLPTDTKLIVWNGKTFDPNGNVTLTSGGTETYGGSLQLNNNATWQGGGTELYSIGGSFISNAGANFNPANSTVTFTTTGAGRTIDTNDDEFYNVSFTGSGSWNITNGTFGTNNVLISNGAVSLPAGTTTVSGFFNNSGGSFTSNGSPMVFDGGGSNVTVAFGGSTVGPLYFTGVGSWNMSDVNATSSAGVTITDGTVSLPSGTLALASSFHNESGDVTHNTSEIVIATSSAATVLASSSDLYAVTFSGGGTFAFEDEDLTLLDTLTLNGGSLELASGTLAIGGSFEVVSGTFDNATGTILFNSADTGETINPGGSDFYNVVFGSATGGWTVTDNATTTNIFSLTSGSDFTLQSGARLYVGGVFSNDFANTDTTWTGSTLVLDSGTEYQVNAKTNGDDYQTLIVSDNTDVRLWNSRATTTTVAATASVYSQDHGNSNGSLYIFGDFYISTTTEYWSYATDFDGTSLAGLERAVTVSIAGGATTTVDGGTLNILGAVGDETTITNQGSGEYAFGVSDGTFSANYYAFRNLNSLGLNLTGTPVISTLSYGDFELAVNGGNLISLSSTTLNANASLVITGTRFATTTAITGTNVYLTGETSNAWTFTSHTGNLDGEDFDEDGVSQCGSVRWNDSSCLITQQTHFRWRNDDGGVGVPDSEWFNVNWTKRKSVRVDNADATPYTDAVVEITVDYDTDMQLDYDDLRFTDDSGVTTLPHFVASSTSGVSAEVWVEVPTLPAEDTATIYMYYGNAVATSVSSSTETFIAADDFEDGNITEYTGANDDKSLFAVTGSYAYGDSSFGLDNTGNVGSRANDGGMARFDQNFARNDSATGVTLRYMQYIDTNGGDDEVCTMFAVQSPVSANDNYAVCIEQVPGTDYISLTENVIDTDVFSGTDLASTSVTYTDGWYEIEVDWQTDGTITVTLYDDNETQVAQIEAVDSTYTTGGFGFTYWSNEGGWDNFTVRPRLTSEPAVRFGAEVEDGGATWAAAQDVPTNAAPNATKRLRVVVENSGLAITNQNFDLEFAAKGAAPSCEAVVPSAYVTVPNQASCGTSALCMQTTTHYVDGAATADLLEGARGQFVAGAAIESPSNTTAAINIDQNYFTELEYAIVATNNALSSSYCLRVTDGGSELDSYLEVAELQLRFDPTLGPVSFNGGEFISLVGGTTTRVYATATVTDLNGYDDLVYATSTMYTTLATAACADDNNDCYIESSAPNCSFTACSGNSCVLQCYSDFYFHADPTFSDGGNFWQAFLEVEDAQGGVGFNTSAPNDVYELTSLEVVESINYGALAVSSTTGSYNPTTTVQNIGNIPIDVNLEGTDLTDGNTSQIPATYQRFATSSFNYDTCALGSECIALSTTTITNYELDLTKPTTVSPPVEDVIYWGIEIPFGVASNPHSGVNTFYAVTE